MDDTDSTWVMVDSSHIKTNTNGKQYNILVYVKFGVTSSFSYCLSTCSMQGAVE